MNSLSGKTVLIADGEKLSAAYLRQRLVDNGAIVHVVDTAAALRFIKSKHIDVAMVGVSQPNGEKLRAALDRKEFRWCIWRDPAMRRSSGTTSSGGRSRLAAFIADSSAQADRDG